MLIDEVVPWVTLLGGVCAAVWAVSKIRATTLELTSTIKALGTTVDRLDRNIGNLWTAYGTINTRLSRIEGRMNYGIRNEDECEPHER